MAHSTDLAIYKYVLLCPKNVGPKLFYLLAYTSAAASREAVLLARNEGKNVGYELWQNGRMLDHSGQSVG